MSIRILHLVQDLNVGGVERVIQSIVTSLDTSRFEVKVIALAAGGVIADELANAGISIETMSWKNCYNPINICRLSRAIRNYRPSIIHMHGYFAETMGRLAVFGRRFPATIVHHHSVFHGLTLFNRMLDHFLMRFTSWQIMISEEIQHTFAKAGYPLKKSSVIYNGVDGKVFENRRTNRPPHTAIMVAILRPVKGHRFLIEAFSEVGRRFSDAHLIIVGDGPLREALQEQAKSLGCEEKVEFLGMRDDIPALLDRASIAVMSSLREGLSLSIIEAMASGLPVVASRTGGTPEVVEDGVTGMLVSPGNPQELAEALSVLMSDSEKAHAMGLAGRKKYEVKFTKKKMISELEALYERFATRQ
jgi:glycosyltransferase involved in cell wall biosynthesis